MKVTDIIQVFKASLHRLLDADNMRVSLLYMLEQGFYGTLGLSNIFHLFLIWTSLICVNLFILYQMYF